VIVSGASEIDESIVTGETARRSAGPGATIYAGSINHSGALTLCVTTAGPGTLIDEIQRLLDKATQAKSHLVRLADRAARFYAPVVHTTAALTVLGWLAAGASTHDAVMTGIAVLIITCPCALALAIPTVQMVASGALFKAGIILNSGDAIERLAAVDTIVFDKTGTLTLPEFRVENAADIDPAVLECAARLALSSHHPLAVALAREARQRTPYDGAVEEPGRGVRALIEGTEARLGNATFCGTSERPSFDDAGMSTIAFAHAGQSINFAIRQTLRPDAAATIEALTAMGFELHILSGDRPDAVATIAEALSVKSGRGGCKPADKIAFIERLQAAGRRVLMVGDGINDAPALAAAHVSLSPISAADIAQAQADAVFLGERLGPVREALVVARGGRRLMMQNLWLAVVYNAIAVPIAIAGYATPLLAAAAMSGSSILVTLNALRARHSIRNTSKLPETPP
jgi:Cu2+-exporting ATPase